MVISLLFELVASHLNLSSDEVATCKAYAKHIADVNFCRAGSRARSGGTKISLRKSRPAFDYGKAARQATGKRTASLKPRKPLKTSQFSNDVQEQMCRSVKSWTDVKINAVCLAHLGFQTSKSQGP
jgi:hypothetical protein